MAAKLGGGDDDTISEINVTPLVDIMLVLLIIFMLTSEAVSKKVVKPTIDVDLPTAASGEDKPGEPLSIVVNKEGALFLNGKEIAEAKLRGGQTARKGQGQGQDGGGVERRQASISRSHRRHNRRAEGVGGGERRHQHQGPRDRIERASRRGHRASNAVGAPLQEGPSHTPSRCWIVICWPHLRSRR